MGIEGFMRYGLIIAILFLPIVSPIAFAHGANDFSIIMRGNSIEPKGAEILQNDTLTFHNTADHNRTIKVDLDGDGIYDRRCDTEPKNSSSIRDQCTFAIDASIWGAGTYVLRIYDNGTIWEELNLTVVHDFHEELGPPIGYTFNNQYDTEGEEDNNSRVDTNFRNLAIILFIGASLAWFVRRGSNE